MYCLQERERPSGRRSSRRKEIEMPLRRLSRLSDREDD